MPPEALDPSEIETAVIVLHYLVSHGFARAVAAFRRDAKQLLKPVRSVPAGIRPLTTIIIEYVALKEAAIRRDTYLRHNPALQEIDEIIARRSKCQDSVHELATQCQRPMEGPSIALDLADKPGEPGSGNLQEAPSDGDLQRSPGQSPAIDETIQLRHTPRKLLRKVAPKRKRLGGLQAPPQGDSAAGADLLNQPVNERMLEQLLAGEWQGRFAEGLASCINSHLGPQEQQHAALATSEMPDLAPLLQQQAADDVALMDWVSAVTEEPSMAALLEPIVAFERETLGVESGTERLQHRSSVLPERTHPEPQHNSLSMALGPSDHERLSRGLAQPQRAQPPGPSQAQDDVQLVLSHTPHVVTSAKAHIQQDEPTPLSLCRADLVTTSANSGEPSHGAAHSRQLGLKGGSPADDNNGDEGVDGQAESPTEISDSEDDIQVRAMDRTALLSSLVGSGTAEGAIESLVASLKY